MDVNGGVTSASRADGLTEEEEEEEEIEGRNVRFSESGGVIHQSICGLVTSQYK